MCVRDSVVCCARHGIVVGPSCVLEVKGCVYNSATNYVSTYFFLIRVNIQCYINILHGISNYDASNMLVKERRQTSSAHLPS